ncbi:CDP-diacylglycerol--serine O-phosphatidyltransferase [Candidatus Cardinium hertigii]|jgi:CDP-diacylglycerol--serine O-phosphatidyltransferase|uniref:CDP-diacylglycerol--serine O-phosphatidyltransferase n=1 Tax=Candidatus Cardinium hertigii TaxID=247481 RepID=A0A3N2QCE9_9BACT|nr:CDP-diacylglycerol--serine O-phosphatidyltransferase [Candidatus Cardinium hertigii]ROT47455.1 CDP-diacylglycerol--serine O-phosphatidyltransferase [Candidatus Cardinium hertigii]
MKNYIPNCLSILNLISGVIGTVLALNGHLVYAAYGIFLGAFFDFWDGCLAKLLNADSLIGKQLDALADLMTFGMLPASIFYMLASNYGTCPYSAYSALLLVICSAVRLAKFNVDDSQKDQFIGLPTPTNALIIGSLPMILERALYPCLVHALTQPFTLPLLAIFLSFLLVSRVKFISIKFKDFSFQSNKYRYTLIALCTVLVALMQVEGFFLGMWIYIFFSLYYTKTN